MNLRPGQLFTNELELSILQVLSKRYPFLLSEIHDLHVLSRKYTGVGCYTEFLFDEEYVDNEIQQLLLPENICLPSVQNGMTAVLLCVRNHPILLEIVTYQEAWDGTFEGFSISE